MEMWTCRLLFTFYLLVGIPLAEASDSDADSDGKECCQYGGFVLTVSECDPAMVYDVATQLCCQGNIRPMQTSNDKCCGAEAYDPTGNFECCEYFDDNQMKNNVSAIPAGTSKEDVQCCGAVAINPEKDECCFANMQYGANDGLGAEDERCCGLKLYDYEKQVCCAKNVPGDPINTYTLFPREGNKTQCCETANSFDLFDYDSDICCDGKVIGKNLGCCNGKDPFDPEKEFCCYSSAHGGYTIFTKNDADEDCCGTEGRYNTKTDLCCSGRIVKNVVGRRVCCSFVGSYDPELEVCCISRTIRIPIIVSKSEDTDDPNSKCNHDLDHLLYRPYIKF